MNSHLWRLAIADDSNVNIVLYIIIIVIVCCVVHGLETAATKQNMSVLARVHFVHIPHTLGKLTYLS